MKTGKQFNYHSHNTQGNRARSPKKITKYKNLTL